MKLQELFNQLKSEFKFLNLDNRYVEFDYDNNVILVKKSESQFAYSISLCLNKKLNQEFLYINLVKLNNFCNFEKVISVGKPIPIIYKIEDIEINLVYRLIQELKTIQNQF